MTKIRKGMPIQISHGSMGNGDVVVSLHPANAKKMMSAFKRGKGLRIQMNEDEVRASGIFGSLKKLGKKVEKGVVDVGNKVAKPTKKIISQIPKPIRDVLQDEAQGLIDTTGTTLGMMIGQATGDEESYLIQLGDNKTGSLVQGPRMWVNALELNTSTGTFEYAFEPNKDYEIRGKAEGYEDIVQTININPQKIEIRISPGTGDTLTTFSINTSVDNATITIGGKIIMGFMLVLFQEELMKLRL